jgi:hypothetical protein
LDATQASDLLFCFLCAAALTKEGSMSQFESSVEGYVEFVDDENGYLRWLEANPDGYVVNSARSPSPNYLVLHRALCKHINSPNRSNWTTTGFIKTCSNDINGMSKWAKEKTGGELRPCGACKPGLERRSTSVPARRIASVETKIPAEPVLVPQPTLADRQSHRQIPEAISTGCPELDLVWKTFAADILGRPHVLISDTEDDLNWHAFLGHSIDMQGFRAAEFVGVDPMTRSISDFIPLKTRGIGVVELGRLWEIDAIRNYLLSGTKGKPLSATFDLLEANGGSAGKALAEAFRQFGRCRFHWRVRAYLQNCAVLKDYGYSFRVWLQSECAQFGISTFPPTDFRAKTHFKSMTLEMALRYRLEDTFHRVAQAMAPYMLCDWQLALWNEGRTQVFANFKLDSFHEEFVKRFGRGLVPKDEQGFAGWWLSLYPELPPRLANECIWLGMENATVFGAGS